MNKNIEAGERQINAQRASGGDRPGNLAIQNTYQCIDNASTLTVWPGPAIANAVVFNQNMCLFGVVANRDRYTACSFWKRMLNRIADLLKHDHRNTPGIGNGHE